MNEYAVWRVREDGTEQRLGNQQPHRPATKEHAEEVAQVLERVSMTLGTRSRFEARPIGKEVR